MWAAKTEERNRTVHSKQVWGFPLRTGESCTSWKMEGFMGKEDEVLQRKAERESKTLEEKSQAPWPDVLQYPLSRHRKWGLFRLRDLAVVTLGGFGIGSHVCAHSRGHTSPLEDGGGQLLSSTVQKKQDASPKPEPCAYFKFSGSHVYKGKKKWELNCNDIFYLTQCIQNIISAWNQYM